ncbi:glycoside hydrolase family 25 protein [Flectobacillus roseus]|uniref:Glycoside hydrolase family 25 protein n=1 Tax=Flectobacillus roseus TaxID=502259 RepID=A0ABT6Y3C6_9BACT|nr:glycoside hydrolase family 25 protein [Flectobacillus roseus]MDI9857964.1 glycoside hydrolase family 25 protein [Flectobacillus roseus]
MKNIFIFLTLLFGIQSNEKSDFYSKPWDKKKYPIAIDAYEKNAINMSKLVTDERTIAIFHRASIGFRIDNKYASRKKEAKLKKIFFASYHLGTNADPIKQADFYLEQISANFNDPMALDIEDIGGNNISLKDAEKFIERIYEKTNRYPFVYVNNKVYTEINNKYNLNSIFARCPLWYARFKNSIKDIPFNVWPNVTLWQFSCELNCKKTGECLYNVPGTEFDMDVNVFNGTPNEFQLFWQKH